MQQRSQTAERNNNKNFNISLNRTNATNATLCAGESFGYDLSHFFGSFSEGSIWAFCSFVGSLAQNVSVNKTGAGVGNNLIFHTITVSGYEI